MIYNLSDKTIVCIGDIHGEFPTLRFTLNNYIKKFNLTNTAFIVCGDCGFFKDTLSLWKQKCRKKIDNILSLSNNELYLFRGNHDNPLWFTDNTEEIIENSQTIKVLKDYDILESNVYGKILIIPGAVSIDRSFRIKNLDWWENEGILKLSDNELQSIEKIDVILSHSLPYFTKLSKSQLEVLESRERYLGFRLNVLSSDLEIDRQYLIKVQSFVNASQWVSGHYHISSENILNEVKYISLDIMEFLKLQKTRIH